MSQGTAAPTASTKATFLETYRREVGTTLKVLRAYPPDQKEFRPHETSMSARELAWLFTMEQGLGMGALSGQLKFEEGKAPGPPPPPPESWAELISGFEKAAEQLVGMVEQMTESELGGTVRFFVAPHTLGDIPTMSFLWFLLHDQIHHRGQFSVYLRMTGSKVPSIYGPSKDEPWF